jgi:flagellar biosynthetic protein FliR
LPLLSVNVNANLLDLLFGMLQSATTLALQLAAPILVTMLVVDLSLGLLGKTMPQFNIMSAGITLRAIAGMLVLIVGIALTGTVIRDAITEAMDIVRVTYLHGT